MDEQWIPETADWASLGQAARNAYKVSEKLIDMRRPNRSVRTARLRAQPQDLLIDLNRSAFVVIDMVNEFGDPRGWIASMGIDIAPTRALCLPINRTSRCLRERSVPVVWLNWGVRPDRLNLSPGTQHPFNPTGTGPGLSGKRTSAALTYNLLQKDGWGSELLADLVQDPCDIHVEKHRISGFWDTPLDAILRNLGVTTLLFAGVNADHCVLGTLMDANFHGYDTVLIEDCVATTSPRFCMDATLHNVRFCFGFTATSEDLLTGVSSA